MPKQKTYEHDYEWNGNSQPQKGVNIKEQNPWPTPTFASVKPPSSSGKSTKVSTPVQPPTDLNELRQAHPWQKPQWATVDNNNKSPQKNSASSCSVPVAIDRDAIPKPMLKKTPGDDCTNTTAIQASDDAIAAMERTLAAAKQRQAAAQAKASNKNEPAEEETAAATAAAQRAKHQSEETKLEQARRVAKEKELERWRATLQERNERDKAKRQQARNGLVAHGGLLDDTAWQKSPPQPPKR
jgi:hypothetical protein